MKLSLANFFIITVCCLTLLFSSEICFSEQNNQNDSHKDLWDLPITLNKKNTKITFEVDSTFILVKGIAQDLSGRVFYENVKNAENFGHLSMILEIPVASLNTNNSLRDNHMYDVMDANKFKTIYVNINKTTGNCTPRVLESQTECSLNHVGSLTIKDVTKKIKLTTKFLKTKKGQYIGSGSLKFNWPTFHVEDPSNFIATVYPEVKVEYQLKLQ